MEKIQKIIVIFLVLAIIFSVISVIVNYSLLNFEVIIPQVTQQIPGGSPNGNVNLVVEGNPPSG